MICPSYISPQYLIFSDQVPALLYYSHLPAIIISLLIGFFVYFKNRHSLVSKILLSMSIAFAAWVFLNLITWTNNDSGIIMLAWSLLGILYALVYILSLYFVYVFIDKKDISLKKKTIFGILLLPIIILTPTSYNLLGFNLTLCGSAGFEGQYFTNYYYLVGIISFLWILILAISRHKKAEQEFKKQIVYLTIGITFFLLFFVVSESLASYLVDNGYMNDFDLQQYGLFGIVIFMGFLAYLIVKFKAFNIKLIATQALVVALVILIGSMLFFAEGATNQILILISLAISLGIGYLLVKSVKLEVQRKEELQEMSDKLALANEQLIKLDNAKSEFISIASHQLRTPLTAIKGFVSLLLEGTYGRVEAKIRDALNKVYLSNERMVELVENLLNISRIESGRMEYQYSKVKVEDILSELSDTFILAARGKGLELKFNLPKTPLPEVEIDGPKTKEVISNLIDNAIKYSDHGSVSVTAELAKFPISNFQFPMKSQIQNSKSENFEGDFVRISVTDTGIGIPKEELPYLFNKFSRGKDTNRLHVTGTGLGLYVGKQMIEAQHGKMIIQSEGAGKGSTFIVELPVSQEPQHHNS